MKILVMGPQASGKGTQAELLSKTFDLPAISVGGLLRELPEQHPLYANVQADLNSGHLVNTNIAVEVIKERISQPDCKNGYIMDGWARRMSDIEAFNPEPDWVLHIVIPRDESIKRITGRRICSTDGKVYNIHTLPKEELEKCKGDLIQRDDDTEAAVNKRLEIYQTETIPVVENFRKTGVLIEIDGMGTPDEVFSRVLSALELAEKSKA